MKVLIGCETSGVVRRAFAALGHDAWSCDLLPAEDGSANHYQGDVLALLRNNPRWDLIILHPPCTYLSVSGLHWNKRRPERALQTEEAFAFFSDLWLAARASSPRVALENPIGLLSTAWRKPDQIIQPHQFGEDASKATCLWLHGLPPLVPTGHVAPRMVDGKPRWANQTDSGQNKLPPSADRWKQRSRTYDGIAAAMAAQWGAA